jgi:hypothetical protein
VTFRAQFLPLFTTAQVLETRTRPGWAMLWGPIIFSFINQYYENSPPGSWIQDHENPGRIRTKNARSLRGLVFQDPGID